MKKISLLTSLLNLLMIGLYGQNLEVVGKAKITIMDTVTDVSANVVRQTDGTLALRQYKIGDIALGGTVFYVDESGEHGLISSQSDIESVAGEGDFLHQWSNVTEFVGATGGAVPTGTVGGKGAGAMNTMLIISAQRDDFKSAARECADLNEGGYGDWYLPSKGELHLMWVNLHRFGCPLDSSPCASSLGNFVTTEPYWSSTGVANGIKAWAETFASAYQDNDVNRSSSRRVRAIRTF